MISNLSEYNQTWSTCKLSDLGVFSRGVSKHRPRDDQQLFEGGGYPLVQTGDVKSSNLYITKHIQEYGPYGLAQSKLWPEGTLCITIAANIADTGILSYPMCFPDSVVGFNASKEATSEIFMHYVFMYIRESIQTAASGSIQDNINIDYLTSLEFKIPSKDYQDKIARCLASIDQIINMNEEVNNTLRAMLTTLYDYWFVQFDFPDEDGKPYRSSGGKMVWSNELGKEIPEGWGIGSVLKTSLCSVMKPGVNHFDKKTYYATADVNGTNIGTGSTVDYEGRESRANMQPILYSVWFAKMKSSVKHLFLGPSLTEILDSSIFSTGFYGLQCTETSFEYIASFISSAYFEKAKDQYANGATQQAVGSDQIDGILLLEPDARVLLEFHNATEKLYELMGSNIVENRKIATLRDWLLPMLMNGQVTLKD